MIGDAPGSSAPDPSFDVIVIGAGPAGAAAAIAAQTRGARTLLLDRHAMPRPKVCGGCLNRPAVDRLHALGVCLRSVSPEGRPASTDAADSTVVVGALVENLAVHAGRAIVRRRLDSTFAIDRSELDAALVAAAQRVGAVFRAPATGRLRGGDHDHADPDTTDEADRSEDAGHVAIEIGGALVTAAAVVLADGGGRSSTPGATSRPIVGGAARFGIGTIITIDDDDETLLARLVPAGRLTMITAAEGYLGLVRLPGGRLDAAGCVDPEEAARAGGAGPLARRILARVPEGDGLGARLEASRWRGSARLDRCADPAPALRVLRAGDAAGYLEPFTGEGMARALASGAAAGALAAQIAAGTPRSFRAPPIDAASLDPRAARRRWRAEAASAAGTDLACRVLTRLLRRPAAFVAAARLASFVPAASTAFVSATGRGRSTRPTAPAGEHE